MSPTATEWMGPTGEVLLEGIKCCCSFHEKTFFGVNAATARLHEGRVNRGVLRGSFRGC